MMPVRSGPRLFAHATERLARPKPCWGSASERPKTQRLSKILVCAVVVLGLVGCHACSPARPTESPASAKVLEVSLAELTSRPQAYVNKSVRVRGWPHPGLDECTGIRCPSTGPLVFASREVLAPEDLESPPSQFVELTNDHAGFGCSKALPKRCFPMRIGHHYEAVGVFGSDEKLHVESFRLLTDEKGVAP